MNRCCAFDPSAVFAPPDPIARSVAAVEPEDKVVRRMPAKDYMDRYINPPAYLEAQGLVFLHAGCLDGDPGRSVVHHIFVGSKAPWFEITDDLPRYEAHKP